MATSPPTPPQPPGSAGQGDSPQGVSSVSPAGSGSSTLGSTVGLSDDVRATLSSDSGWSPSVRTIVSSFGEDPIAVSDLVDAMLTLHETDYLTSWDWAEPAWPDDLLRQPTTRWMAELRQVVTTQQVFGRVAIVGWCLLDDRAAAAAQTSGLLAGIAAETKPSVLEFLTPQGRRLLRRRAPLVALTVDDLAPSVEVRSDGVVRIAAVGRQSPMSRTVDRWATEADTAVFVGRGPSSQRVQLPDREGQGATLALGWSRRGVLHRVTEDGVARYAPREIQQGPATFQGGSSLAWPSMSQAAVGESGIAALDASTANVLWAASDGGVPVTLGMPVTLTSSGPGRGGDVAIRGDRVATVDASGAVAWGGPDMPWTTLTSASDATGIAASTEHILVGDRHGELTILGWGDDEPTTVAPVGNEAISHVCASDDLAVVASTRELVVMSGTAVVGRFRPADDDISAIAVSPDGRALLVATGSTTRIWRIDAVPEVRLTEYSADSPEGEDLLDTQPTVDALAAILAAKAVEPPLALGLFGAWGSGKTFFMRRLERRVDRLSRESHDSGRAQSSLWAWRNVRQVQFNAWHYASADVWAGMLEQLVRELAQPASRGSLDLSLPAELSEIEKRRVQDLAGARVRVTATQQELEAATEALDEKVREVRNRQGDLAMAAKDAEETRRKGPRDLLAQQTISSLDSALKDAGITQQGATLGETLRDIDTTRRTVWAGARARDRRWLSWALLAIISAGLGVTVLLQLLGVDLAGTIGMMSSLVVAVSAGIRWLGSASEQVQTQLDALDQAEARTRAAVAEMAEQVRLAEQARDEAARRVAAAERERETAEHDRDRAQERVRETTPGNLLVEYLEGRHTAGDYRSMLGLIGTVRRDLEIISQAVERNNKAAADDPARPPDDVVNRIVLYVDDLDRCPPKVVVQVLEAVAMLLTFPMFVVVVAVDAHWITKSLAAVYPEMLKGGEVTPDNYLEKIFQMPVWLDRPTTDGAKVMARSLLAPKREDQAEQGRAEARTADESRAAAREPAADAAAPQRSAAADVSLATTPPAAIALADSEVDAIEALAPLVARTPRALKRYLNTYRVLKALVRIDDLAGVRLLLAVATGNPEAGERLLGDLAASADGQRLGDLVTAWPEDERQWLTTSLASSQQSWEDLECQQLRPLSHYVRRFVFHATPSESATDDGEAPAVQGDETSAS